MKWTLQSRLMVTFLSMIALLAVVTMLIQGHARSSVELYQASLSDLLRVAELTQRVDHGVDLIGRLATDPVPERVVAEFEPLKSQIHELRRSLPATTVNPDSARMMRDLNAMSDSFLIEAGASIYAFRDGAQEPYFNHDEEAATIAEYIRDTSERLLAAELEGYRQVYPAVIERDQQLLNTNLAVMMAVTMGSVLFVWGFSQEVTNPLRQMVHAAGRIAGGDLEGPPVPTEASAAEMEVLGLAFNHMQDSLRQHVSELKAMVELERRLQAEELENLQIHTLLREAELRALQSQVNPHFLFNTLNMVSKTALLEGAERTSTLLETVADLLRYSLRPLDAHVTLRDEVAQVKRYMTIQAGRFRERFLFDLAIDESALTLPIPCLTLQPLVENALIHGLGSREEGGLIRLRVDRVGDRIQVVVADNGVGISPERLALFESGEPFAPARTGGHTTGLGFMNVRRRVELFYGGAACTVITSQFGQGTTIMLDLPDAFETEREGVLADAHPGSRR